MNPSVLVTDGEQRSALAVVRSLGRAGYRLHVCASRAHSLAAVSRYVRESALVPDPLSDPRAYASAVGALVRRWGVRLILPVTDASHLALLPALAGCSQAILPGPTLDAFRRVSDKAEVLRRAAELGIAVPRQHEVASSDAVSTVVAEGLEYPIVIKPARSVHEMSGGERRIKLGVHYGRSERELLDKLSELPAAAFPVLLQRRIGGPGVGVFLLLWEGRLVAAFSHRRLREKPPSGGVSVYRESVPLDPELLASSRGLLEAFGWQGVAMVEYKVCTRTGTPFLMEVNGRFWGSLQLAIDAGVDFPRLLAEAASGAAPAPVLDYRVPVRSRWLWGDVDHLLARLFRSDTQRPEREDLPSRGRLLLDFVRPCRPAEKTEVLRLSDPKPFVRESVDWWRGLGA
ncbi:MAG: ATP-grasp domain-containing protein [Gemmatimonadota bacterium]